MNFTRRFAVVTLVFLLLGFLTLSVKKLNPSVKNPFISLDSRPLKFSKTAYTLSKNLSENNFSTASLKNLYLNLNLEVLDSKNELFFISMENELESKDLYKQQEIIDSITGILVKIAYKKIVPQNIYLDRLKEVLNKNVFLYSKIFSNFNSVNPNSEVITLLKKLKDNI